MSWKGFQKAVVRMPQLVKQKTGMVDSTTDAEFDELEQIFESGLKAVGRLAEDVTKYRAAMQQWTLLTQNGHGGDHEYHELEIIVAQLNEYHNIMKRVAQKITKRNHKLIDYDRHRNSIRSLQANKNRSVSEERSMIRAEEAFQQAQREYDEWNSLLKQELPLLLASQRELVKPIYAELLKIQKKFFSQFSTKQDSRGRATEVVVDYEDRVKVYYERLDECEMTRVGGLSTSRHPSSMSVNSATSYSSKPLPQPNVSRKSIDHMQPNVSHKSIDQMVSEMQLTTDAKAPKSVTALFDFTAQQPGDLSFKAGDIVHIIEKTDHKNDWWRGRTVDGREGIFPGNYVQ